MPDLAFQKAKCVERNNADVMNGQCICVLFLYTVCHALYCFQVIFYKQNAYHQMEEVLFKSFGNGQVVTERSSGHAWTCFPSIQVWEVGTLITNLVS